MKIRTHFKCAVPDTVRRKERLFSGAAAAALKKFRAPGLEVNIILVDERDIRKMNRQFLGRGCATDVIAFNYPPGTAAMMKGPKPFGDIYICAPRAKEQAAEMGHSLITELLILVTHGALHLAGMDDATLRERKAMNARTARLLKAVSY